MQPFLRFFISSVLFCLILVEIALADEQGLLWRIQGKSVDSYLFGTIHSEDSRVTQLPEPVEKSFNSADILMLEISLDHMTTLSVAARMMQGADGSLSKQVGKSLAEEANSIPEAA